VRARPRYCSRTLQTESHTEGIETRVAPARGRERFDRSDDREVFVRRAPANVCERGRLSFQIDFYFALGWKPDGSTDQAPSLVLRQVF
jgi:hypothetical protein